MLVLQVNLEDRMLENYLLLENGIVRNGIIDRLYHVKALLDIDRFIGRNKLLIGQSPSYDWKLVTLSN